MGKESKEIRAETVGSLLRPLDAQRALAARGDERDEEWVQLALDDAVRDAIAIQQEAGLDVITDGEMRRRHFAAPTRSRSCFVSRPGPSILRWRGGVESAPAPEAHPVVVGRVGGASSEHDYRSEYEFLARNAQSLTKYTMPAPSYHRRFWSAADSTVAYGSCEEFLEDVRDFQREMVQTLLGMGCKYIQLDAPNYGSLCDPGMREALRQEGRDVQAELAFDADLDSSLFEGIRTDLPVTTALHICRGNAPGGRWNAIGGYGAISGEVFPRLRFDRLLLEYDSDRAGAFGPLSDVSPGTLVVLGLITTKSRELESEDSIVERVREAARLKPLEELALSTQCGFASTSEGNPLARCEQQKKLQLVAKVARRIWS